MFRHGRIRHLPSPCRGGGSQFTMTPCTGLGQTPEMTMGTHPPPTSRVIHLPGTIQNCITSILYPVGRCCWLLVLVPGIKFIRYSNGSPTRCKIDILLRHAAWGHVTGGYRLFCTSSVSSCPYLRVTGVSMIEIPLLLPCDADGDGAMVRWSIFWLSFFNFS